MTGTRRHTKWARLRFLAIGIVAASSMIPLSAFSATFLVQPGPATIQTAITSASAGDSIVAAPGLYELSGGIGMKSGLTLVSQAGPAQTILKKSSFFSIGPVIVCVGTENTTIEGFTVTYGSNPSDDGGGGGFKIRNCSPVVRNNLIVANATGDIEGGGGRGAGISVIGGAPTIEHNTIVGNYCDFGAIDVYQTSAVVQFNIIAYTNTQPFSAGGMGISCEQSSGALIANNLLWGNRIYDIQPLCSTDAVLDNNVVADPKFCNPIMDTSHSLEGDWRVALNSPAAPGGKCAGWGASLDPCPFVPALPTSWGKVKAHYRN